MFDPLTIQYWLVTMIVLIIAVTLHEAGHAFAADWCGDDTPRNQGRLSFNPIDHLEPFGTLAMALSTYTHFGIGWGRPVQINPSKLKHPRWDLLTVAVAGPATNVVQALLYALAFRIGEARGWIPSGSSEQLFLLVGVLVNISLVFFNLIPVPPLDGSKVLIALLPAKAAIEYEKLTRGWATIAFIILAVSGFIRPVIGPPVTYIFSLLIGHT